MFLYRNMLEESTEAEAGIPLEPIVRLLTNNKESSEPIVESEKKESSLSEADRHSKVVQQIFETEKKKQRPPKKPEEDSENQEEDEDDIKVFKEDIQVFKEDDTEGTDVPKLRTKRKRKCRAFCKFLR